MREGVALDRVGTRSSQSSSPWKTIEERLLAHRVSGNRHPEQSTRPQVQRHVAPPKDSPVGHTLRAAVMAGPSAALSTALCNCSATCRDSSIDNCGGQRRHERAKRRFRPRATEAEMPTDLKLLPSSRSNGEKGDQSKTESRYDATPPQKKKTAIKR